MKCEKYSSIRPEEKHLFSVKGHHKNRFSTIFSETVSFILKLAQTNAADLVIIYKNVFVLFS